jgi:carbonic anhydrase
MLTRRQACGCIIGALGAPVVSAHAAEPICPLSTPESQAAMMPAEAVAQLKEGNQRFLAGKPINCNVLAQVQATAARQTPFAAVVGCMDSRVPPEIIFDQRIGDIFCARVAGNVVDVDFLGSLEYGTAYGGAKAIVVLGHTDCGAILSAIKGVEAGHITALLEKMRPAIEAVSAKFPDDQRKDANADYVKAVTDAHVLLTAASLTERSPILRDLVENGKLVIAPAVSDLQTGEIRWLES